MPERSRLKTCTSPDDNDEGMKNPMSQAAINKASRHAKRTRSLGPDPSCARCGYDDPDGLGRDTDGVHCYECRLIASNRTSLEKHHHLGRKTDPATIAI